MFRHLGSRTIPTKNHRRKKQHSLPQRFPGNGLGNPDGSRTGASHRRCCDPAVSEPGPEAACRLAASPVIGRNRCTEIGINQALPDLQ